MVRPYALAVVVACVALVAGCGFRLQGSAGLPPGVRSVRLSVPDELSPVAVELRHGLERAGATEAPAGGAADAVIRVLEDRTGRRVLAVSARNTPTEFEIFYVLEYAIDRAGQPPGSSQRHELTRNFSFDESLLLAKDREEEILREAMARDLAGIVLRRLESLPAVAPPAQSGPSR
jgi:LPS-assembly lipoprotein